MQETQDDKTQETNKLGFEEIMALGRAIRAGERKEKLDHTVDQVSAVNAYGSKCFECGETNLMLLRVTIERLYWVAPRPVILALRSGGYPARWHKKTTVLPSGRRSIEPGDRLVVMCDRCRQQHQEEIRKERERNTGSPYQQARGVPADWRKSWKIRYPGAPVYDEAEVDETLG
jgi:hypothetical protein